MIPLLLIVLLFSFSTPATAQFGDIGTMKVQNQSLSVAEILTMAVLANNDIEFKHCTIRTDSTSSDPAKEAEWRAKLFSVAHNDQNQVVVGVQLQFDSCKISAWRINDFAFTKGISFNGCAVDEYLGFKKCLITNLGISKTSITTGVEVEGLVNFEINRCVVGSCVFASSAANSVNFNNSTFSSLLQIFSPYSAPLNELSIEKCIFDSAGTAQFAGHIRSLALTEDTCRGVLGMSATILNMLMVERCAFGKSVMYEAFNTPERATTLRWEQFANFKLAVKDTVNGTNVVLQDDYETLLKTYSFFYNVYNKNWQDESKNACYVEMKNMQTRWMELKYRENPLDLDKWMVWRLNVFLRVFCVYGTEPVMAIKYSLWIVLLFGALYFIFPSQPEDINSVRFTYTFYNLTSHQEERNKQAYHIQQEMEALRASHERAPKIISILGAPFFYGHIIQYRLRYWFVQQSGYVKQLQEQWDAVNGTNKTRLVLTAGGYFLSLLLVTMFLRLINAFALSVNAFVTLGYGEIQAIGIARYLAVCEGALGWFLLSIFSVSLISQILQ